MAGPFDLRVSVLQPNGQAYLTRDASADFRGGRIRYEDTPGGCGGGELDLGLLYEDVYARSYWTNWNIVEISTGDDTLQQTLVSNLAPSSDTFSGWTTSGALAFAAGGPGGATDSEMTGTGGGAGGTCYSPPITLTGGQPFTFSVWGDPSHISSGNILFGIWQSSGGGFGSALKAATLGAGASGRVSVTYTPAVTTTVVLLWDMFTAVVASGQKFKFSQPMLENKLTASAWYAPSIFAGARLYCGSTQPYDVTLGEDNPLVYLWDGSTLTMGMPVTGVGTDGASGKPYITVSNPLTMPGNPATIGAYGAGATLGRRRYAGVIKLRDRPNIKTPKALITLAPLSQAFDEAFGGYTIGGTAAVDISAAISSFVTQKNGWSDHWPHLTINAANFTSSVGATFSGSRVDVSVGAMIQDAINAVSSGDKWFVRLGHDRTPRLVRLYTLGSNTYAYTLTLTQGTTAFEPLNVQVKDQDASVAGNQLKIVGNTDPATQQPVSAIVQDTTSISTIGRVIDAPPQTVTALATTSACASYARGWLNSYAFGHSVGSFTVYTRNDGVIDTRPRGLGQGDVVRGVDCVTIAGFLGGAPNDFGLVTSVVSTLDVNSGDRWQDVTYSAVEPDINQIVGEKNRALALALHTNTPTSANGTYSVNNAAYPPTWSGASLVLGTPAFWAVFAAVTAPVSLPANNLTLPANSTVWVYVNGAGVWTTQTNYAPLAGYILYGYAQTNASGIIGFTPSAPVTWIALPVSYMLGGVAYTPTLNGAMTSLVVVSPQQFIAQMQVKFEVTNQPTDGSLGKVIAFYRKSGAATWMQLATSPPRNGAAGPDGNGAQLTGGATSATGDYGFIFPDASKGVTYEFGAACESAARTETAVVSLGTLSASNSVPAGATIALSGQSATVKTYAATSLIDINVTLPYAISGTTATDWIDRFEVYCYYYDPRIPGKLQIIKVDASSKTITGTLTAGINGLPKNYAGAFPSYAYGFELRAIATDGSAIAVDWVVAEGGTGVTTNAYTNQPTVPASSVQFAGGQTVQSLATTSTALNAQGSLLPTTTDFVFNYTFSAGTTTMTWYACGAGGSGSNITFYRPDGSTFTAPFINTVGSKGSYNAGSTGQTVYALIYWNPTSLTWTTSFQTSAFTAAQVAAAYADGYVALVATYGPSQQLVGTTGTAGGGSAKGGRSAY